jgi:lipid-A-disaccharide synthase
MNQLTKSKAGTCKMKYFIISGEPSGDLHGSKLIKGIFKSDPKAEIAFWGGDLMEENEK